MVRGLRRLGKHLPTRWIMAVLAAAAATVTSTPRPLHTSQDGPLFHTDSLFQTGQRLMFNVVRFRCRLILLSRPCFHSGCQRRSRAAPS